MVPGSWFFPWLSRRMLLILASALAAAVLLTACSPAEDDALQFGLIPALTEGMVEDAVQRLTAHMEEHLDRPVNIQVYADYNPVVERMGTGDVDVAYLGPRTYVIANHIVGAQAIVTQVIGDAAYYHSYLITTADAEWEEPFDLNHLRGHRVGFADPASTSGSLVPQVALAEVGIDVDSDIDARFLGSHDITAHNVADGLVAAGFIDSAFYNHLIRQGEIQAENYRVLWQSEPLFQYPWAVHPDLDRDLVEAIREAFLAVDDEVILGAFGGASAFTTTSDEDYEAVRQLAIAFGDIDS